MLAKIVKAWHRRRRVGPQTECASKLSRAKACTGWAPHWLHSHPQPARWVNFGLLRKHATANPFTRASCYSWSSKGNTSTTVWQKNQERTTLPSTISDRQRVRVKRKNVCKSKAWRDARTWKHILRHEHFRAKYRYVGVFSECRFQPLSVGGFFSNQRESTCRCPTSPFPSKTQNRQIARFSPLNSISREQLNFRRRPILCTTLYRNPIQANNSGGSFDQLSVEFFYALFTQDAPLLFLYHAAKK